jgi:enoyl-CoA hydratase/carnithine racemase
MLTRLVGTSRARELLFLSERIDARRCETMGLVNRVVPDAELGEAAFALARSLAAGPSIALAHIKDNLDHALKSDFPDSMDYEAEKSKAVICALFLPSICAAALICYRGY